MQQPVEWEESALSTEDESSLQELETFRISCLCHSLHSEPKRQEIFPGVEPS